MLYLWARFHQTLDVHVLEACVVNDVPQPDGEAQIVVARDEELVLSLPPEGSCNSKKENGYVSLQYICCEMYEGYVYTPLRNKKYRKTSIHRSAIRYRKRLYTVPQ